MVSNMKKEVIGNVTLYLADCYELLPEINADLYILDPMYGGGSKTSVKSQRRNIDNIYHKDWNQTEIEYDDVKFNPGPFLKYKKVVFFGANHYNNKLPDSPGWIVWDKRDGMNSNSNSDAELAWTNYLGRVVIYRQLWNGLIRAGRENTSKESKRHPYQKPVDLGHFCIKHAKLPNNSVVAELFGGSGSFSVAAIEAGHKAIYIEKIPEFFYSACKRIEQAQQQQCLFY